MKEMIIGGKAFEVHKSKMYPVACIYAFDRSEIFEHYDRPSQVKISIWNRWCDWCCDLMIEGYDIGIQIESANCFQFTITGRIEIEGEEVYLWITKNHNRAYVK